MVRWLALSGLLATALTGAGSWSSAGQPEDRPHAVPTLVTESESIKPGGTTTLGVSFEIDPGWHLYWDGTNDTGMPISVELTLPDGLKAGTMLWPAPHRHVMPGDILDHIYEKRVTLLIPLEVSDSLAPGAELEVVASLRWLECKEACLLRNARVSTTLRVASAGDAPEASERGAALIGEARARLPKKLEKEHPPVAVLVGDGVVRLEAKADGVRKMAFYPGNRCVPVLGLIKHGESNARVLELPVGAPEGERDRIDGVVEVFFTEAARGSAVYRVDVPLRGA